MIKYILKQLGYLHIDEIKEILEEEATQFEEKPPYNPYKLKSEAWWQQSYHNKDIASEIRQLKLSFKIKLNE